MYIRAGKASRTQPAANKPADTPTAANAAMQPTMFDRLLAIGSDIFFVLDQSLRFVYVSGNFQKLLKIDDVPLDNSPIMCYLSTESYIDLKKLTTEAEYGTPVSFQAQLIGADRQLILVNIAFQKENSAQGQVCFMGEIKTVKLKQEELNSDKNIYLARCKLCKGLFLF